MAERPRNSVAEEQAIDMTPMTDCVFLLLIFFMVTTVFKNPAKLEVHVPYVENPMKLEKRQIIAEVDAQGNVALNGTETSLESFDAYLLTEKTKTGNKTLLIKADRDTKHGEILKMMVLARSVGIEQISIAVDTESRAAGK
jgi:biopolymer transport protein ExbD